MTRISARPSAPPSAPKVVIVGAGPTGLTAANLLGQAGVETLLLEQNTGLSSGPKALMVDDEFFRLLNALGLADALRDHGVYPISYQWRSPLGLRVPYNVGRLTDHNFPNRTAIFQPEFEQILLDGALRFPCVSVRFGEAVVGLEQNADGVNISVSAEEGQLRHDSATYVLGADGARSTVRKLLNVGFEELVPLDERHIVVDVADDPDVGKTAFTRSTWSRRFSSLPAPGGRRYEFSLRPEEDGEAMLSDEGLTRLFKPWRDFRDVKVIRKTVYSFRACLAERLQKGRVFLLGDAAHIMPVTGSQGMNSGARDANNLAWKLAMVLGGAADDRLLATYEAERREQVEQTIRAATAQTKLRAVENVPGAILRDLGLALALLLPSSRRRLTEMRYMPKPHLREGLILGALDGTSDGFVGRLLPNPTVSLDGKERLLDDVVGSNWALIGVDPAEDEPPPGLRHALWTRLRAVTLVARPMGSGARSVPGRSVRITDAARFAGVLAAHRDQWLIVRPDRIVAAAERASQLEGAAQRLAFLLSREDTPVAA